jgi:hypothetical protein
MVKEVGIIAHSCGVTSPRALNRSHARVVQGNGTSLGMDEIFPDVQEESDCAQNTPNCKVETEYQETIITSNQ